ncbi:MAG: VWA domain-containing protein [Burkholderiales bacterium]|nr:VWA domain-containing protein [Burkholderiales bacterium]
MLEAFHFIEPMWLLGLLPLLWLAWRTYRPGAGENPWRRVVDAALLPLLMTADASRPNRAAAWLLAAGWAITVLALANPAWEREPQRVFQSTAARVIVLDLSQSMNASDLAPSRLVRARYKIEDILAQSTEGQTGLVVYAGDAFTVTPLTRDANTIRAQLKALDPDIMPAPGSRADLGLRKAGDLLRQAGSTDGDVLLIADGIAPGDAAATVRAATKLRQQGYRVSVLGVIAGAGTTSAAAPAGSAINGAIGGQAREIDASTLPSVAQAGGGEYQQISADGQGLKTLLRDRGTARANGAVESDAKAQKWKGRGPILVLLLLPLAALAFRRNWLLAASKPAASHSTPREGRGGDSGGALRILGSALLLTAVASPPQPAMASTWDNFWRRPDQQAASALRAGDYDAASKVAQDPDRLGAAEYKLGNYQKAAASFARATGADADYNRGNALAKLGKYREAIAAYDKALEQKPDNEDAVANKAAVEALLKKHQQQQKQASNSSQSEAQSSQSQSQNQSQSQSQGHDQSQGQGQNQGSQRNQGQGNQRNAAPGKAPQSGASSSGEGGAKNMESSASGQSANTKSDEAPSGKGNTAPSQQAEQADPSGGRNPSSAAGATTSAQGLSSEEQMAADQWLRRIPDDPGGLLRRKFLYQYRQRAQQGDVEDL